MDHLPNSLIGLGPRAESIHSRQEEKHDNQKRACKNQTPLNKRSPEA